MNLQTLKNEHPETYAQVVKEAQTSERSRVLALLKMGDSYNKLPYAIEQIKAGKTIHDDEVAAEFFSAMGKKRDIDARKQDDPPDVSPPGEKSAKEEEKEEVSAFVAEAQKKLGLK